MLNSALTPFEEEKACATTYGKMTIIDNKIPNVSFQFVITRTLVPWNTKAHTKSTNQMPLKFRPKKN